ncbi:NHL repeat-containing protein [Pseudoblastomonas halimionae]|uniref:SMP-30/Gluconolactonase/LRE-like region domain-containing protein n=1 Tax=Alteriqipengyuania halimionae TaxID=1926630 RepID=A0A6I4U4R6_9SPHN|nr:hypothetical protein [Alteriqipengyuania halimionae]MXP09431.1 hypothetical protein [Alteriqipengyuania halimionae]
MKAASALVALSLLSGCALAALGTVAGAAAAAPEERGVETWRKVDATTGRIIDIAGLEQLSRDFPDSASVRLRLATAYIREGDRPLALEQIHWLLDRGYAFSPAAQATLLAFFEDFDPSLEQRLVRPVSVLARSTPFATIPAGARLIEGIAKFGADDWAATSIVDRTLYIRQGQGGWMRKELPGAGSLAGIVVAPDGETVWTASGVYAQTPMPDTVFRGLIGWNPRTGSIQNIAAPADATPSDLVTTDDGTLYASDPLNGAIYSASPGDERMRTLVGAGTFRSPQGLVPVDGGRKLLVSDYRYGLATVNLRSGEIDLVATDLPVALDGIDGMWAHGNRIVAVQNGFSPQRLVLLSFDKHVRSVTAFDVLESGHPDWIEPIGGTVVGGIFYYNASGQWRRYGAGGTAKLDAPPLPTQLRSLPLPPAKD